MFKKALAFSLAPLSMVMMITPVQATEQGEVAGQDQDLKVVAAALMQRDYAGAEAQISAFGLTGKEDPAMLINLGNAYAGMGRKADAQLAYKAALNSGMDMDLDMADGSVRSSRAVARDGLRQLGVDLASW
ncbi:MAG: tetratricopeptide repeat protein [Sphingomonadales bacterium]|nr:MAG: tetratricopeptide repeat protein [Sphingomonadales bacterium]TNF01833.1 MAG: tetratricopeptide repeat protein [Sphingomonadales bacterium]